MSSQFPPLVDGSSASFPSKLCRAVVGRFLASYHSQLTPMLARFMRKYHKSHSRNKITFRLKFPLPPPPQPPEEPPIPPPALQSTELRSKCVPNRTEPGVAEEPVNHPFGLQM